MRWLAATLAVLMTFSAGSIGFLNSPGASSDPEGADEEALAQYIGVVDDMRGRWQTLDAACDPDMVFSLLYLVTTAKVGDLVADDHFADNGMLVAWDEDFASRYFAAYDAYHAGQPTPEPWRIAFEHADSGNSTVTQDLLLGMNAHVNYDLAFSAHAMGLPQKGQKAEFDRVNDAFWNVVVPMGDEMGARYEPSMARSSDELGPQDYAIVELLISWRENAWHNAQLLATTPALGHPVLEAAITAEATAVAQGILQTGTGNATQRQAYCHSSGHPPLAAALGGHGYGADWIEATDIWMCHHPGPDQKSIKVNEHSRHAHEGHGDTMGRCEDA